MASTKSQGELIVPFINETMRQWHAKLNIEIYMIQCMHKTYINWLIAIKICMTCLPSTVTNVSFLQCVYWQMCIHI
jgi:hypothetical protein